MFCLTLFDGRRQTTAKGDPEFPGARVSITDIESISITYGSHVYLTFLNDNTNKRDDIVIQFYDGHLFFRGIYYSDLVFTDMSHQTETNVTTSIRDCELCDFVPTLAPMYTATIHVPIYGKQLSEDDVAYAIKSHDIKVLRWKKNEGVM